jgi:hypothetical protein
MLYAVRLPALLTAENQQGYIFVGVRCEHCDFAYSVAVQSTADNSAAIPGAIEWTHAHMGPCGAHPAVIYEKHS